MTFRASLASFVLLGLTLTSAYAVQVLGPVTDLHIVNANISTDGFTRPAVLAGGTFPGPLIAAKKGDNFKINVIDDLTNEDMLKSTSIHWHGLFQKDTNWADGPAFVTQCPITTGNSFLYDFRVPDQAGTYWYHSHLSTQYCDGLRGVIVIYDPKDPHAHLYDVDDESTIITLADWYHTFARQIPGLPIADTTLINGLGRNHNGPADAEISVINVRSGKRYRFRLVSISCDPNYVFSIDDHDMKIIEVEGTNIKPITVDSIQIFAAQRYSFVLRADRPVNNYWVRANPSFGNTGFAGGINSAILHYHGAPNAEPNTTQTNSTKPLNEIDLHPLVPKPVPGKHYPGGADVVRNLVFGFTDGHFTINNATFTPPTVPVLLQILSGTVNAQDLLPSGDVIELPLGKTIELTLAAGVIGGPHPFHLHGHTFHVVRSAGQNTSNYADPILRDTVNTGVMGDNVTIRFRTDNPGPWFLHCHIDWHLEAGFAVVLAEGTNRTRISDPTPDDWDNLCDLYDALPDGDQ
ncbi:laccase, multicopper oxidase, benzenediol:oxygen oxidorectuctase [Cerrena zonata]|uniref:laccase n=1 Tax=Cerrena zonata TaxID=2478898 RepID=A0AAW0FZL4_9APHY